MRERVGGGERSEKLMSVYNNERRGYGDMNGDHT